MESANLAVDSTREICAQLQGAECCVRLCKKSMFNCS